MLHHSSKLVGTLAQVLRFATTAGCAPTIATCWKKAIKPTLNIHGGRHRVQEIVASSPCLKRGLQLHCEVVRTNVENAPRLLVCSCIARHLYNTHTCCSCPSSASSARTCFATRLGCIVCRALEHRRPRICCTPALWASWFAFSLMSIPCEFCDHLCKRVAKKSS